MRPGGGKQKGAQFERDVCVALSRWVSAGASDSCFWRSAMSGGRATVRFAKGKSADGHGGDITATDPRAHLLMDHFTIECKFVKELQLQSFVVTDKGNLKAFWAQAWSDAVRVNKEPMLIAKQNQWPPMLLVRSAALVRYFPQALEHKLASIYRLPPACMFLLDQFLEVPYAPQRFAPAVPARIRPTKTKADR